MHQAGKVIKSAVVVRAARVTIYYVQCRKKCLKNSQSNYCRFYEDLHQAGAYNYDAFELF